MTTRYADVLSGELRSLRKTKGYERAEVSDLLGLSARTMTRWETVRDMPCLTRLVQLATEVFEIDPQSLLLQLARSAPDPRVDILGIPAEQSVLRAGVTHYLATHKMGVYPHIPASSTHGAPSSAPRRTTLRKPRKDRNYATVLGEKLFYARTITWRYNQYYVSRETGIGQSNLSQFERGLQIPELVPLVRLAKFYHICVQDLLIKVARETIWDPTIPLLKIPQGLQILEGIPEEQPVLSALVAYELGSRIPRKIFRAPKGPQSTEAGIKRR